MERPRGPLRPKRKPKRFDIAAGIGFKMSQTQWKNKVGPKRALSLQNAKPKRFDVPPGLTPKRSKTHSPKRVPKYKPKR